MLDKTLLILDDDPLLGQTIQRLAQHIGITAQFCQTPDVFFELLESWQPDFLAIDLIMPQMDGVQVLLELAQRKSQAKIILTSGAGQQILSAAARSAAARNSIAVISKPISATA